MIHRWVAVVVGLIVVAVAVVAWRTQRQHPVVVRLAVIAAILFPIQALIGGLQVLTRLEPWTQTLHLALGAFIWGAMAGLVVRQLLHGADHAADRAELRRDRPARGGSHGAADR